MLPASVPQEIMYSLKGFQSIVSIEESRTQVKIEFTSPQSKTQSFLSLPEVAKTLSWVWLHFKELTSASWFTKVASHLHTVRSQILQAMSAEQLAKICFFYGCNWSPQTAYVWLPSINFFFLCFLFFIFPNIKWKSI